jgi:hypothetical protein
MIAKVQRSTMTKQPEHLSTILESDLGIAPEYRHISKRVTPGEMIEPAGAVLKWYAVHPEDRPVPDEITRLARSSLLKTPLEARGLGFVVLHRCGNDFYFLIVCTWRGSNEVWETVFYKDGDAPWLISRCLLAKKPISRRSVFGSWLLSGTNSRRGCDSSSQRAMRQRRRCGSAIVIPASLKTHSTLLVEDVVDLGERNGVGERVEGSRGCDASGGANEGTPCDPRQGRAD